MSMMRRLIATVASALVASAALFCAPYSVRAQTPSWLGSSVIYCVDPEIFSTSGISGVTAQLSRLHSLGVNTLWLMPIYPRGVACTVDGISHPSFNSPYDINNFEGVDPNEGTSAQLTTLISTAHGLGMKVILDVALSATSWDNPLITSTPQYYLHSDGNVNNVASIEEGFGSDADIAGFDLSQNNYGAQTYVTNVMDFWETNYGFDGFRFDSADDPSGTSRTLPQSLAESIATSLQAINPNLLLLGEEFDNESLALAPYGLDYDVFNLQGAVEQACTSGNSAAALQTSWQNSINGWPAGMEHMAVMQDWDLNEDLSLYGGTSQTMDAAVFNFTIGRYVPEIFNGEEVANTSSGDNTHNQIIWNGSNATAFTNFYTALIALHVNNAAMQTAGTMTWETNSNTSDVSTYDRASGSNEFYVEINFNGSAQSGTLTAPSGASWTDVSPSGSPGGTSHELPSTGDFSLKAYDFAIFQRGNGTPTAATPTISLASGTYKGSQSVTLSDSTTGASIYYTTNGATPTTSSTKYTGAITVATSETIEAMAAASGDANSGVASATYSIYSGVGGGLSGTVTPVTTAQAFNLTTMGNGDWAAWGFDGYDHDSSGGSKISNVSVYGGGSLNSFTSSFLGMTWTNGTPDVSETNETNGYYNAGGIGDGFTLTAPASTTTQTLTVFVGGWTTGGTLNATLSDGSAAPYTNSSLSNSGSSYFGYYTFTYFAASAGQTLTVTWQQASGTGNVTIYGAALSGAVMPTTATPTFSPAPGTYTGSQSVTLSDTTSGASIYYTTNGTTPTTSSTKYTGAIAVTSTETIEAIAAASGDNNSNIASGTYTINTPTAATPTFSPAPGSYTSTQSVTLADTTTGASIYYTTNGTTPTTSSTKYTAAISVPSTETIEAMAAATGYTNSSVASGAYTIITVPAAPTGLTPTAGNATVSLSWTASSGAATYNVYRGTSAGGESGTAIVTGLTATTYSNSGLTNGTKYYYEVKAVNAAGTSAASNEASATPTAGSEAPYGGTAAAIPGTVYADAYDTGGSNVGYSVSSVNGTDNGWRSTGDGVDLEACSDTTNNGADVGWSAAGQWFRYTVNVATAGTYKVSFRVANGSSSSASLDLQNSGGTNLSGTVTVPATGGWATWTTVTANVTLPAGQQVLEVYQGSANFNLNYMSFAAAGSTGSLSGSPTTVSSAQAFNLTTIGTTDWAAWGFDGTDRDTSGGSKIGTLSTSGGGSLNTFVSSFLGLTWTNGTPDASETNETDGYYNNAGVGDGFTFTVPASTAVQHVTVYVGGWSSGGTLTATLSDGSATAYTDSSMSNSGNSYYGYYTLAYNAASASQTLSIVWKEASGSGNVTVYGAALH